MSIQYKIAKKKIIFWGYFCIFLISLFASEITNYGFAIAQGTDDSWSQPVNLSRSGAATNPVMVVDSDGIVHVIWEDQFDGWEYSRFEGNQWSTPTLVTLPFGIETSPRLFADSQGYVHALWIAQDNSLVYSRVTGENFGNGGSWEAKQVLAGSAMDFDLSVNQGKLHLAYVRIINDGGFPAGIYYRNSNSLGTNWSQAISLYESPYFRSLTKDNSNVRIASAIENNISHVFVVWDNQPRKQVFLAKSNDGGDTWDNALSIDQPDPITRTGNPFDIRVTANSENAILFWQNGSVGGNCNQFYKWSVDGGNSWSERQQFTGLQSCPQDNYFIKSSNELIILQSILQGQLYLTAWDIASSTWSEARIQQDLSGFSDPETYNGVIFGCQQLRFVDPNNLYAAGCDTAGGGDVWVRVRQFGNIDDWFPDSSAWSSPDLIATNLTDVSAPIIINGQENRMHVIWTQVDSTVVDNPSSSIYYAGLNNNTWTLPVQILKSQEGNAVDPHVVIDHAGRMLIIWKDADTGELLFSWANENRVSNPGEWSDPISIPTSKEVSGNIDIQIDESGTIDVVYAIRLNEDRGIYLIQSNDVGQSWSVPIRIFDGADKEWDMVDEPQIAISDLDHISVIWKRYALSNEEKSIGLYYSRSDDNGANWTQEEEIVEGQVIWSRIIDVNGLLYRFWQVTKPGFNATMYTSSQDQGMTWSQPQSVSSSFESQGQIALAQDLSGRLHVIQTMLQSENSALIKHWQWDEIQWSTDEYNLMLGSEKLSQTDSLTAAISPEGSLGIVITGPSAVAQDKDANKSILYTARFLELPALTIPTQVTASVPSVISPTPTIAETLEPTLTESPPLPDLGGQISDTSFLSNGLAGLVFGGGLSVLLIAATFGFWIYSQRRRKK